MDDKTEIYLLIILVLVILVALSPSLNAFVNDEEECRKEGDVTLCRKVYTRVTTDWHVKGGYKLKGDK